MHTKRYMCMSKMENGNIDGGGGGGQRVQFFIDKENCLLLQLLDTTK